MSLALVHSRARAGVHAPAVRIEVLLSGGLPHTQIVGLPEAAVRESRDRVRAALVCAQFEYPQRRILINLAPADLPKEGGRFDLAIALGILAASDQIDRQLLANYEFLGELALTGELRGVDGALPAAIAAAELGRTLIVASANGAEAALAQHADVRVARTLLEVCAALESRSLPRAVPAPVVPLAVPDLRDVRGQQQARRALEVAAAGGHHLLLLGTPGCGKTLLASRLPGILPDASEAEALETATIASCSGAGIDTARWRHRPYRAPHHTASAVSLVGGGSYPRPGEISLAHNGVLFLDELPEWSRHTLEVLREPLESGTVMVARAARTHAFPSRFQLVAVIECILGNVYLPTTRLKLLEPNTFFLSTAEGSLGSRIAGSEKRDLAISVERQRGGRRSIGTSLLDLSDWPADSALYQAVVAFQQKALLTPMPCGPVSSFRRALKCLQIGSIALLRKRVDQITAGEVVALLHAIEGDLQSTQGLSINTRTKYSAALRQVITSGPDVLKDGNSLQHTIQEHFPRLRRPPKLRRNDLPASIAVQSHEDWDDLRQKTHALLQSRNNAIESAIANEFAAYERLCTWQEELLIVQVPEGTRDLVLRWMNASNPVGGRVRLQDAPISDIVAVLLQEQTGPRTAYAANGWPIGRYPVQEEFAALEGFGAYLFRAVSSPWFHARDRLPNAVLTAIFLALMLHTGWNTGSVGSLTLNGIQPLVQGGYRLQGYKGKTDDDTPVVDIPPSARMVCKAVSLLLWNRSQLEKAGLIDASERRVWFGWQRDNFSNITAFTSDKRIHAFCERNGLERFRPSEIRTLKAGLTYLPQRDLEAVRVLLGHNDLTVTDSYLRDTLFFRMNEANMLQFQRRIETTITFAQGGETLVDKRQLRLLDVDAALMLPTGDGGLCTNPFSGPPGHSMETDEPCAGLHCQTGVGCPHYRLHADEHTLEMALRTQSYYRARWFELSRSNPEAFSRIHLPRLLYMHVLLKIVQDRRPDLLRNAQRALT